jgi:hypothetical protein
VTPGGFACFYFEGLGANPSDRIECAAPTCIFIFDPDDSTDGVGTATVWIRECGNPEQTSDNQCGRIHDSALTGLVGGDGTQLNMLSVRSGWYYVEVVGDGAATDDPWVSIQGERK